VVSPFVPGQSAVVGSRAARSLLMRTTTTSPRSSRQNTKTPVYGAGRGGTSPRSYGRGGAPPTPVGRGGTPQMHAGRGGVPQATISSGAAPSFGRGRASSPASAVTGPGNPGTHMSTANVTKVSPANRLGSRTMPRPRKPPPRTLPRLPPGASSGAKPVGPRPPPTSGGPPVGGANSTH